MFLIVITLICLIAYALVGHRNIKESVRGKISVVVGLVGVLFLSLGAWTGTMFYADPGYSYQVRTITGDIIGYNTPGWHVKLFGTTYPWKKAMSVANTRDYNTEEMTSSMLPPERIRMLDRVDGHITQTTRFRLPEDMDAFLRMAAEYRTPENLLLTELVPTVRQVITASSSLMSAEDYFNGQRNDFQMDFDYQMREGIFLVNRREVTTFNKVDRKGSADASKGEDQDGFGDHKQTRFVVTKLKNADGTFRTRNHNYKKYGITVVDAKVTEFDPNDEFKQRMKDQQQASADRSIAREQRIQEEEQKQLVIVRGERMIAEEQAQVLRDQVKRTTAAETDKALALISADKLLKQAAIEKETALVNLDRDTTIAKSKKVLADADKYERQAKIAGDNALQQKLDAEVKVQSVWASAFSKRAVPQTVFVSGGGGNGDTPSGGNTELQSIMQMMTMQMAKQLDYSRTTTQ